MVHNSAKPSTTLHTSIHKSSQLHKTHHNFYTTLHNFTQLYKLYKTLQNPSQFHFNKCTTTLRNSTKVYKSTQLYNTQRTIQRIPRLYTSFTQTLHIIYNFNFYKHKNYTQLRKTKQNSPKT